MFPLIPSPPSPTLIDVGPIHIGWYGIGYVIAIGVLLWVTQRELERRGIERTHLWNAFLLVFVFALVGGRLYHVIDQWEFYRNNLVTAILPVSERGIGFAGLGVYGGVAGAALAIVMYTRWKHLSLRLALDAIIPGTLFAQGIARWGNYFNQELYGPPTDLPWGITIDCAYRVAQYPCELFPFATTGFHPLFFYESALNIIGGLIALWLGRRFLYRLYPGDLAAFWGIWYGATRSVLEFMREGWNWTLGPLGGIPTAQVIGMALVLVGVVWIGYNHRPGRTPYDYPEPILPPPPPPDPFADEEQFEEDEEFVEYEEAEEEEAEDEEAEDEFAEDFADEDEADRRR